MPEEATREQVEDAQSKLATSGLLGSCLWGGCQTDILASRAARYVDGRRGDFRLALETGKWTKDAVEDLKRSWLQHLQAWESWHLIDVKRKVSIDYRGFTLKGIEITGIAEELCLRCMSINKGAAFAQKILPATVFETLLNIDGGAGGENVSPISECAVNKVFFSRDLPHEHWQSQ